MKIQKLIYIAIVSLSSACGGGGGGSTPDDSNTTGVTLDALSQDFPLSENGNFKAANINQSFVCIDEVDEAYYALVFDPSGTISSPGTTLSLPYSLSTNQMTIDVSSAFGSGVSYQHNSHILAGDLVVGFIGNLTDGIDNAALACIAAEHSFSDAVPETTTIACESGTVDDAFDFSSESTNRFTLEPGHYAQRNYSRNTYSGTAFIDQVTLSTASQKLEHGSYLFDQASGEFVMGFMRVDLPNADIELLVFEGQTDGNNVNVELANQMRNCVFE